MATYYWRGSTGSFNLAAGWMVADVTGVLSPATAAPDDTDTVVFDTAGMTLSSSCSFAGLLRLDLPVGTGALNLNGHTLSLLSTSQLGDAGGKITGAGTLETDAISAVPQLAGGVVALQLTGGATWSNAGLVLDAGMIASGPAAGDSATVVNQPGALFALAIDQPGQIASPQGGGVLSFLNQGTLAKTGGTGLSSLSAVVTNSGIISASSGTLELAGGGVLGGIIGGDAGEVRLAGTFALAAGTAQAVSFSSGAAFGGGADGAAVLRGPGTLASSGTVRLTAWNTDQLVLTGGAVWNNGGTVTAAAGLGFGATTNDSGTLVNRAGAVLAFSGDTGINVLAPGGSYALVNAGTLSKTGGSGTSRIAVPLIDSGSIVVAGGTLELAAGGSIAGPVTGCGMLALSGGVSSLGTGGSIATGLLLLNGGTLLAPAGSSAAVSSDIGGSGGTLQINGGGTLTLRGAVSATQTIRFNGAGGTLIVNDVMGFAPGAISGFGTGDALLVVDSAADVAARIDTLESLAVAGALTSIRFTDSGTPVLSLAAAQFSADLDALAKIVSPYQLASGAAWVADRSGTFGTAGNWSSGSVPGALSDAVINFADAPTVTCASGSYTLHSLSNVSGHFVLSGGTLAVPLLDNRSSLAWNGGSIVLNGSGSATGLRNETGGTLTASANGQRLSGTGGVVNAGAMLVQGGTGEIRIDTLLSNTGSLVLNQGTLSLTAGGSSAGDATGTGGTLNVAGGTFTAAGSYAAATAVNGGTLDLSNATGAAFRGIVLNAGGLLLGAMATGAGGRMQQTGGTLSGSGTLTAYAGAQLTGGLQTGPGTTQLLGDSMIGGIALDDGRTLHNDGGLTWSAGSIMLGGGNSGAAAHAGTLSNAGVLRITAGAVIGPQSGGSGLLYNAGIIIVSDGIANETDLDAQLVNEGLIQLTSGTLSVNGGGYSDGQLLVGDAAVMRIGSPLRGEADAAFSVAGGYAVANTVVDGGTLDLAGASRIQFSGMASVIGGGMLLLGRTDALAADFSQDNGIVRSGGNALRVSGTAHFNAAVQSGTGTTTLLGQSSIDGVLQLDGGHTLENDGTLVWNAGSIGLGGGDATAVTHAGWLVNAAGGVLRIAGAGTVAATGSGGVTNAGTLLKSGSAGNALVATTLSNSGTVLVQSGTLTLADAVTGAGVFEIDGAARLDFASVVGSGESIRFVGGGGTLAVEQAGAFAAPVSGFTAGDALDLTALGFAAGPSLAFATKEGGGTLTVNDGTHGVTIGMLGSFAPAGFHLTADGHGGVLVGYT